MNRFDLLKKTLVNELYEIKTHLCNERYFEGGVALGYLQRLVSEIKDTQEEDNDEQVQEEEYDEECEESSLKEAYFYEQQERDKEKIRELERKLRELEKNNETLFPLQELLKSLVRRSKINYGEVRDVLDTLRSSGVEEQEIQFILKENIGS